MAAQNGDRIAEAAPFRTSDPTAFLQHLALESQVLACLRWLGDHQVLACIPLSRPVTFKDVGDLADVSVHMLSRVVRVMAIVGFLREPQPNCVAHSELSARFVERPALLDAAMFLAETSLPAALHMAEAARRYGDSQKPHESPYNVAFSTPASFAATCENDAKLHRRWTAFRRHVTEDEDDSRATELLMGLNWSSLGAATVVEAGAQSTAMALALADRCPSLHIIVQLPGNGHVPRVSSSSSLSSSTHTQALIPGPSFGPTSLAWSTADQQAQMSSNITVQQRDLGMPQMVDGAAAYILHLPVASPASSSSVIQAQIVAEISVHAEVLRVNSAARLILVSRLLVEPGTVDHDVEAMARLYDLSLLQVANQRELEVREVVDMLKDIGDVAGELVVVSKLVERRSPLVAFEVRFKASTEHGSDYHIGNGKPRVTNL